METPCIEVANHHEVLIPWAEWREKYAPDRAPEVVVLDHHTDVVRAWRDPSRRAENWRSAAAAVPELRHDEHLDWAVQSGLVSRCTILAHVNRTPPASDRLVVRRDDAFPEENIMLNRPDEFRPLADRLLESDFLERNLGPIPEFFILDIDCDYFPTEAALHPGDAAYFHTLVARAQLVTLSRESDWVRILRLPGESVTGASVAAELGALCARLRR